MLKRIPHWMRTATLSTFAFAALALVPAGASAVDVERKGDAMVVYIEENAGYYDVVERVKASVWDNGWRVTHVEDVDTQARRYERFPRSKVIEVTEPEYVAKALSFNPMSALVLPAEIVVFQEPEVSTTGGDYTDEPGRIGIAYIDPNNVRTSVRIPQHAVINSAANDLEEIVMDAAKHYAE